MTGGPVRIVRIPDGREVLEPKGVTTVNANGESRVQAADGLASSWVIATHASQIIRTSCQVEHGFVAKDEVKCDESLWGDAIVVVAVTHLGDIAGCSVTDSPEDRALERYRWREPPLIGSAEREGGA